jgi:shikimate kinase
MSKKIIIVGYMGCGKSTIAKKIAKMMNLPYLELDEIIEQSEKTAIKTIFNTKGELYFRKIEHNVFNNIIQQDNFVLSTGGGTPCYYNNHLLLQNDEVVSIYLKASIQTLFERLVLEKTHRPLIASIDDSDLKDFIAKHLFERAYFYFYAKHIIKVDNLSVDDIVAQIKVILA